MCHFLLAPHSHISSSSSSGSDFRDRLAGTKSPIIPCAVLNRLMGLLPSVMSVDFSPRDWSSLTCISGPATAIAWSVWAPIASTWSLNLSVSIVASSFALFSSRSFCSFRYFSSASLALVSLSSSDSCQNKTKLLKVLLNFPLWFSDCHS